MLNTKPKFPVYNSGVLRICEDLKSPSSFGATRNTTDIKELRMIVKLPFKEKSTREQDLEFAESHGRTLSLKVQTNLYPSALSTHSVLIKKTLYSIIRIDRDYDRRTMFLYLEEARKLS